MLARGHPGAGRGGFRVIAPDLRGAGWSDAPASGYDKEQFASDALALLDALGIEQTAWIGHDWGGWTGQLVALRAPERVERLMLCNIAPVWGAPRLQSARNARRLGYQVVGVPKLGPALHRSPLLRRGLIGVAADDAAEFTAAMREPGYAEAGSMISGRGLPRARRRRGEIEWAHGTGHFIVDEQPALVAERVLAFLGAPPRAG